MTWRMDCSNHEVYEGSLPGRRRALRKPSPDTAGPSKFCRLAPFSYPIGLGRSQTSTIGPDYNRLSDRVFSGFRSGTIYAARHTPQGGDHLSLLRPLQGLRGGTKREDANVFHKGSEDCQTPNHVLSDRAGRGCAVPEVAAGDASVGTGEAFFLNSIMRVSS